MGNDEARSVRFQIIEPDTELTMNLRCVAVCCLVVAASYAAPPASTPQIRLAPREIDAIPSHDAGAGTSGVAGIHTTLLVGDPAKAGPYAIRLSIPANTKIRAHSHRDDRSAVVVTGTWYFAYGANTDRTAEKELPAGSFYTEPAGAVHYAETKSEPVVIVITGTGPSDTVYQDQ